MRPWTNTEQRQLKDLAAQGVSYDEIAGRLDRSLRSIYRKAHRLGLPVKPRGRSPHLTPEQVKKAIHYRNQGWTLVAIGAALGVPPKTASRAITRGYKKHACTP